MSVLTKVFVILLVVLSLVETAGIVVFVNRTENFAVSNKNLKDGLAAQQAKASAADDRAAAANDALTRSEADKVNIRNSSQQTIDGLRAAILEKDTAIAQANSQLAQITAAQKSVSDALAVAQKTNDTLNGQAADLRKTNMDLQKRDSENSLALVALNNKFDTVNRQWRDATEQNTELQNQLKGAQDTMKRVGLGPTSPTLNAEAMVRVEGVVRKTQNMNGVPMATISVGSVDQVTKGMRFSIIDRNAADPFLGYLTVERVEPNEAIGTVTGPHINQIHAGVEVRTQL